MIEDIKEKIRNLVNDYDGEGLYNEGVRFGLMLAEQIVNQYKEGKDGC